MPSTRLDSGRLSRVPLGGGAHAPHEFVLRASLRSRAEVALAVVDALLG